jgi:hypothetical protein
MLESAASILQSRFCLTRNRERVAGVHAESQKVHNTLEVMVVTVTNDVVSEKALNMLSERLSPKINDCCDDHEVVIDFRRAYGGGAVDYASAWAFVRRAGVTV